MRKYVLLAAVLTLLLVGFAQAAELKVPSTQYPTIEAAVNAATDGDTINVQPGMYTTNVAQVAISNKSITITGDGAGKTIIKPGFDTGATYGETSNLGGWFFVQPGASLTISGLTLDGAGHKVFMGILAAGDLTATDCVVKNISYGEGSYYGFGMFSYGTGATTITRCTFSNIERVGMYVRARRMTVSNCVYYGKGVGEWLDYGIEAEGGGYADVSNVKITNCLGVAHDKSDSAGILATTYRSTAATPTGLNVTGSTISNCASGIYIGYVNEKYGIFTDTATLTAYNNNLQGNMYGVTTASSSNEAIATGNWWGDPAGPVVEGATNNGPNRTGAFVSSNVIWTDPLNAPLNAPYGNDILWLSADKAFVKPGTAVSVSLNQSDLFAPAVGYQAFVLPQSETSVLGYTSAAYSDGNPYTQPISDPGQIFDGDYAWTMAAGSYSGVQAAATLGSFSFAAKPAVDGVTSVLFADNHDPMSYFAKSDGDAIAANTIGSQFIYVDSTDPEIVAPDAVTTHTDENEAYATVTLTPATVSDNYGIASLISTIGGVPTNNQYPIGVTTVIWTVTDLAGNTATAPQTVTVLDAESPVIIAPANVIAYTDQGKNYATDVEFGTPVTSDNSKKPVTVEGVRSDTKLLTDPYPLGTTTITWTAVDPSNNEATATQTVTVKDNEAPVITSPQDYTAYADAGTTTWSPSFEAFDSNPDFVKWTVDRYAPAAFDSVTFDGDKRLHIGIKAADSATNRPGSYSSAFYNTQGRALTFPDNIQMMEISAKVYIDANWTDDTISRRSDLWGVGVDANGEVAAYPVIGFIKDEGGLRFRTYDFCGDDTTIERWTNVQGSVAAGWHTLKVVFTGTDWKYYIDGQQVSSLEDIDHNVRISRVMLQAYNFGQDYDVYWDDVTTASVLGFPQVNDNVGVTSIVGVRSDTKPLTDPYPIGTTTITWTAKDAAGNTSEPATQTVTVQNLSKMSVKVVLEGATANTTRDIDLVLGGAGGTGASVAPVTFNEKEVKFTNGVATIDLEVPATAKWTSISAKDPKHTLRMNAVVNIANAQYVANFASNPLKGGDLTDDDWVDILDFGVLSGQYGSETGHTYPYGPKDADITGDGKVLNNDFTFIQINFLKQSDPAVGAAIAFMSAAAPRNTTTASGPRSSVTVAEMAKVIGMGNARKADINKDGVIDTKDVSLFLQKNKK